jgi:hypothetical protein
MQCREEFLFSKFIEASNRTRNYSSIKKELFLVFLTQRRMKNIPLISKSLSSTWTDWNGVHQYTRLIPYPCPL